MEQIPDLSPKKIELYKLYKFIKINMSFDKLNRICRIRVNLGAWARYHVSDALAPRFGAKCIGSIVSSMCSNAAEFESSIP